MHASSSDMDLKPSANSSDFTIRTVAGLSYLKPVYKLYSEEGWNDPTDNETKLFWAFDPGCLIVGMLDGEVVSTITAVNCDETYSILIGFVTRKELRGRGYGSQIFKKALNHTGDRKVCLYAAPGMAPMYAKYDSVAQGTAGFCFTENPQGFISPDNPMVLSANNVPFEGLTEFDRRFFPANRAHGLRALLQKPGSTAKAYVNEGNVLGYGVVTDSGNTASVGPLFATNYDVARDLAVDLLASVKSAKTVYFQIFEENVQARRLAEELGLARKERYNIMYRNGTPSFEKDGVYAVCLW